MIRMMYNDNDYNYNNYIYHDNHDCHNYENIMKVIVINSSL